MEDLNTTRTLLLALLSALAMAALHLLAPRIRKLPGVPERTSSSFAGGIAVSYVFLHLLPELSAGNEEIAELLGEPGARSPLLGLEIFLVALVGFTVFYGLERWADRHHPRPHAGSGAGGEPPRQVFVVHLGAFALYNLVIGYSLPLNWRESAGFAVLYTIAIGLHFVLSDRGLEEHYGDRFDRWPPRLLLAGALLVGWGLASVAAPTSGFLVSLLTAFLAGSILLNVFKEEIPSGGRSHFAWFVGGLALYTTLLVLVTVAAERSTPEGGGEAAPGGVGAPAAGP